MKKEKILVGKRSTKSAEDWIFRTKSELTNLLPRLEEFIVLDNGIFQDLLNGGETTRKDVKKGLDGEIEKMVIVAFRKELMIKSEEILSNFDRLVSEVRDIVRNKPLFIPLEIFSLNSNIVDVDEERLNPLMEEAANVYLTDEEFINLYQTCTEVKPVLEEIFKTIRHFSWFNVDLFGNYQKLGLFTFGDNASLEVNAELISSLQERNIAEQRLRNNK